MISRLELSVNSSSFSGPEWQLSQSQIAQLSPTCVQVRIQTLLSSIKIQLCIFFKTWILILLPFRIWRNGSFLSSGWRLHNLFRADQPRCQNYPSHWCISQSLRLEKKLQRCSSRPNFFHSRWTWFSLRSSKLFRTQATSRPDRSQRNEIWLFSLFR